MRNFKRILCVVFSSFLIIGNSFMAFASEDDIKLYVDGSMVETNLPPQIINDRVYVAVRPIYEALGIKFTWDNDLKLIGSYKDGRTVLMYIGRNDYGYQDEDGASHVVSMDAAAVIIDGYVYAPARYVAEAYNYNVDWDSNAKTVNIKSNLLEESSTKNIVNKNTNTTISYNEINGVPDFGKITGSNVTLKDSFGDNNLYCYYYFYDINTFSKTNLDEYIKYIIDYGYEYIDSDEENILEFKKDDIIISLILESNPKDIRYSFCVMVFKSSESQDDNTSSTNSYSSKNDNKNDSRNMNEENTVIAPQNETVQDNSSSQNDEENSDQKTIYTYRKGEGWVYESPEENQSEGTSENDKILIYKKGEGWVYVDAE